MDLPISPGLLISLIIVVIGILIISKGLVIVRQSEVMVIERLGSFHRVLESGINIIVPFIEQPRAITMLRYRKMGEDYTAITTDETRIDRRETVMDFPGQPVVTTDNVTVRINGALYYQIIDPKRAVYEVENMSQAVAGQDHAALGGRQDGAGQTVRIPRGGEQRNPGRHGRTGLQVGRQDIPRRGAGYRHAGRGRVRHAPADGRRA